MLFDWLTRHRVLVFSSFFLFVTASLPGLSRIQITPDNRVFYGPDNTQFNDVLDFEAAYTSNNNIIFVVNFNEPISSQAHVEAIKWLTDQVWTLENVIRVDSLASYPHVRGVGDEIYVEPVLDYFCPSPSHCKPELEQYLEEINLKGRLVGKDLKSTGIIATLNLDLGAIGVVERISHQADELVARFKERYPGTEIVRTGGIPMMIAFSTSSASDLGLLLPVALLVISLMLYAFFGGARPTLLLVAFSLTAAICTMGIAGWFGHIVNAATSISPLVIFTIVTASSMHLVLHFLRNSEERSSVSDIVSDVRASLEGNLAPMLVSAFTSIVGLLSLSFVDSPPLQRLGQLSALGTGIGVVFAVTVLPLSLAGSKIGYKSPFRSILQRWLNLYARRIERRKTYAVPGLAILMLLLLGLFRLEINDDFVDYFDQDTIFRVQTDRATELLSGPNHIEVLLENSEAPGVFDPEYVAYLVRLTEFLRAQTNVSSVSSFLDILEELGDAFESPISASITSDELAQWYLVYELSLQRGQSNTDYIRSDHLESRISVLLGRTTSNQIKDLEHQIYEWHKTHNSKYQLKVTGENIPVAHLSQTNISSMIGGFGASVLVITIVVGVLVRSIRLALVALVGTLAPVVLGFGAWGALGLTIGLASTAILAVTIGVVIDDAVHMLYRFIDGKNRLGLDSWHSAAYSVHRAGMAVATTSAVMVAGLSILLLSTFKVNSSFGAVTCIIISIALLFDLFILPRLLVWSDSSLPSSEYK